jgi:hypothetical protein
MRFFKPKPIIDSWANIEKPLLELGLLGRFGAVKEYALRFSPEFPGQIEVYWVEAKRRNKTDQQAFAIFEEETGPQCPHCTARQIFAAIATTAAEASAEAIRRYTEGYKDVMSHEVIPMYLVTREDGKWQLDCKSWRGNPHTKYDCPEHR